MFVRRVSSYHSNTCAVLESIRVLGESPQTVELSHMHKENWETDRSAFELRRKLGAGQFGEVGKVFGTIKVE